MNLENVKTKAATWWNANKDKVEIGAKCLGIGLLIGFAKGMLTESNHLSSLLRYIPDPELVFPHGESAIEEWWENIDDDDFDIIQRFVHEAE